MSQGKCILNPKRHKHITERERYEFEIILKENVNSASIAKRIVKAKRTVEREIIRGRC